MSWTRRHLVFIVAVIAAICSSTIPAEAADPSPFSQAVTEICAHALMFEGSHAMGTRAGALEVADDIRASAGRRLARVAAVPAPSGRRHLVERWLALERRLAETYALSYVGIFDVIAAPRTSGEYRAAARRISQLEHAPDRLRRAAGGLERLLRVPDCSGG